MKTHLLAGSTGIAALPVGLVLMLSHSADPVETHFGRADAIGAGAMQSFVTLSASGAPIAVGVTMTPGALEKLPAEMNTESRCFDMDGDGAHGRHECIGDFERILEIPTHIANRAEIPFKWVSVNWNPEGHQPPAPPVYTEPHFDFHFYTWDRERVEAIAPGRCGEFVDCTDFERARKPLAPHYLPPGHIDVGAVVPRMGNHLLDASSPELQDPPERFTRTFIYGAFGGELIFWEPMITHNFLSRTRNACFEISQPEKFRQRGYYPSQYCVKFDEQQNRHTVTLERFVYAEAQ